MTNVSPSLDLVKTLRAGFANDNPLCFCQCGKFCPKADACIPVKGEIHQPFWTLREVATGRGRAWVGVLYDPQEQRLRVTALAGIAYPTPCKAAEQVMIAALRHPEFPIRLDQNQFCQVDLAPVERQIAQRLWDMGYTMFVDHDSAGSSSDRLPSLTSASSVESSRHPLIEAGYNAAQAEAEAAISEKDPGFTWDLSTVSTVSAGVMPQCPQCGSYLLSDGSCARGCR